ncbi:hypothetical protein GDN83_10375 [Gordonia jinghuaiqii]|uniref:Uncharacterized protein n=1 Tax=Gordonia jinghuaiqii TaxID=2758710 RepID=A0A7D7M1C7_9ACTN|nr:hypothetical protein [Gordonia jinghuaiqii]MCR5978129.1 hypothetical protein [Gordonia jinghuaiqii]QMT04074.1 hypothetical protein H1R19_21765 [Gordonia jinghuaiqii]
MNGEGCWSTVVCRPTERAALGLSGDSDWLLQCRLAIGHRGNHATDASTHPRHDRRLWLEWNDFDDRAQSLIERNPCQVPSPEGAACVFFVGHGGPHFYARTNGHAPAVMTGAGTQNPQVSSPALDRSAQPQHQTPARMGSHRLPDSHQPAPTTPQPQAAPEPAPEPAYRGGRRATNAEPFVAEDYHGRRHRVDEHRVDEQGAGEQGAGELGSVDPIVGTPAAERTNPPATSATSVPDVSGSGISLPGGAAAQAQAPDAARLAAIGTALDEVATALSRLAAALRS